MSKGFVLHSGGGRTLPGAGGSVLAGSAQTDGTFSLLLSHAPPGDGAPLHVHDRESESFFVLAGQYRIECGDEIFEAAERDFVYLPSGIPHAWQVVSAEAGIKLVLAVPGGIEAFFDDLADDASLEELTHHHGVRFIN